MSLVMDRQDWHAAVHGGPKELDMTEQLRTWLGYLKWYLLSIKEDNKDLLYSTWNSAQC